MNSQDIILLSLSMCKRCIYLCKSFLFFHSLLSLILFKGLSKRLEKLGKERDCQEVKGWRKSSINHLYWCSSSSQSGEEAVAKWCSITNHVQNVHQHSNELFPNCAHSLLTNRAWLSPSMTFRLSTAYAEIVQMYFVITLF